jgi:dihydroneopterin aldolase
MAEIKLEGMTFFSHHGYYAHERIRGGNFIVDVIMDADIEKAAINDDLLATINYETVYRICSEIMEQPVHLIETLAFRMAHEIRKQFPEAASVAVRIHKLSPELGGNVHSAQIHYRLDQ